DFSECSPEPEDGVDALVRTGVEYSGELCVVAIGPLTNIALATLKDPDFARNVKTLYVMGGSNNGRGNITAAAEFNFYVDPEAAKLVFQAGFDVVVVPWDPVTLRQAVFSRLVLDEISEIGTELSRFFGRVTKNTLVYDESVGIAGSTHPDSLTTAIVLHPELATRIGSYHVDIEAESDLTRGYSAMSWGVHGLAPNARVVEEIDSEGFYRYIAGIVSIETRPSRAIRYPDSG
ncbi:MAG: nucleoside hydrolase, partial [Acidimicrobiia bacterium]|nr:nucleoside hydrolase [Acidimicrobiia bacterium]